MTEQPTIDDDAIVAAVLAKRSDTRAIYRFGSTITGYARPESDVDVAVLVARPLTGMDMFRLTEELTEATGREVDLMDLSCASTVARWEVITGGRRLFTADEADVAGFELSALRDMQDLNHRSRELDAQLVRSGWPHA